MTHAELQPIVLDYARRFMAGEEINGIRYRTAQMTTKDDVSEYYEHWEEKVLPTLAEHFTLAIRKTALEGVYANSEKCKELAAGAAQAALTAASPAKSTHYCLSQARDLALHFDRLLASTVGGPMPAIGLLLLRSVLETAEDLMKDLPHADA